MRTSALAHVDVMNGVPQSVLDHPIDQLRMSEAQSTTNCRDVMWNLTHALCAAGYNYFVGAQLYRLRAQND